MLVKGFVNTQISNDTYVSFSILPVLTTQDNVAFSWLICVHDSYTGSANVSNPAQRVNLTHILAQIGRM